MGRLDGKKIIITGASAGIGKASALLFAQEGADLGLMDIKAEELQETAELVRAKRRQAIALPCDVGDASVMEQTIHRMVEALGGLDGIYNNAGGGTPGDGFAGDMDLDEFEPAVRTNLFGPFLGARFAIPALRARGGGFILNTASIRSQIGTKGADAYGAAKGGVEVLTRSLALQLAPDKIRVNAIAPGAVMTERVKKLMAAGNDTGPDPSLVSRHVLGLGEPHDVAKVALFFASDDSAWVTGQTLPVDGGASAV